MAAIIVAAVVCALLGIYGLFVILRLSSKGIERKLAVAIWVGIFAIAFIGSFVFPALGIEQSDSFRTDCFAVMKYMIAASSGS